MAVTVVNLFQAVQVKVNQGKLRAVPRTAGKPLAQGIHGMETVVRAGQVVGQGNVPQVSERAGQSYMHVHAGQKNIGYRRLAHEIGRSGMEPLRDAVVIFPVREEHYREVVKRELLAYAQAYLVTVQVRHVYVQENQVDAFRIEKIQRLLARTARHDAVTHLRQHLVHLLLHLGAVIDHENLFFDHRRYSFRPNLYS